MGQATACIAGENVMKRILVIGASRGIGLEVVREALGRGFAVRALARSAERMAFSAPKFEKWSGSALDAGDVAIALADVDAVVLTLGMRPGVEMLFGPVRLFSAATRVIVPSMQRLGIGRLICVTGFGAGDSRQAIGCLESIPFRLLLGRAYDDKDVQESLIRESGLDWVIARPVILTDGPKTGRYEALDKPERWRNGFISRADVADFLLNQVDGDNWLRKSPVLRAFPVCADQ
jgi:putative NADH-flavin reductase